MERKIEKAITFPIADEMKLLKPSVTCENPM
jgi:hypothetical protein